MSRNNKWNQIIISRDMTMADIDTLVDVDDEIWELEELLAGLIKENDALRRRVGDEDEGAS